MPDLQPKPISPLDVVRSGLCIGCGSCVAQAETPDARIDMDRFGQLRPMGPRSWLAHRSETLAQTCPFSPGARTEDELGAELFPQLPAPDPWVGRMRSAYVGYVAEDGFRARGSSGGLVSWVAEELLRRGLVDGVAHVVASEDPQGEGRFFRYRISRTEAEIRQGAKSRYYPVELSEVVREIRATPGRYAVVGVPCFIKALRLLCRQDPVLRERVRFTLGLFCGHMKSARMIESFAWQMGVRVEEVQRAEFRIKDPSRPASTYTAQLTLTDGRVVKRDWWNMPDGDWGAGFFQYSACNFCDDVVGETADISFGDAWVEPYSSDGNGTNVAVIRSAVVDEIIATAIAEGRLKLDPVDSAFVERTQAAGFRQRREGLAYRLTWPRMGIRPRKRVSPDRRSPTPRRKLIYRMRSIITAGSHRMFWLARISQRPQLYLRWASLAVATYHGLAYSRGKIGELVERLKLQ